MAAKRKCSGSNKNAFFGSCSSSSSAHVAVELDFIFASAKHRESGFNRAWQDEFPCHAIIHTVYICKQYVILRLNFILT